MNSADLQFKVISTPRALLAAQEKRQILRAVLVQVNEWIQGLSKIYVFIMFSRFLQKLWYVYWHMMI